ncbi:hypothetical protein [Bacillus sp. FJAT-52991]|uniref:Uncharacterized protein n=1 Tax=Bacillus kandeliae TaxID=3129297 RepID=A0ABZ2N3U9_9BACI
MSKPDLSGNLFIERNDAINLLLASVALEEIALAHVVNAEAEKIQKVVGTLNPPMTSTPSVQDLIDINKSVERTLEKVIAKELVLLFKLEQILEIPEQPPGPPVTGCSCSAFFNQGDISAVSNRTGSDVQGKADPLRLRFCDPCDNPKFNEVLLHFNANDPNEEDFTFNGFVTKINACDPDANTIDLDGAGEINGVPTTFHLTIANDLSGNQVITFTFTPVGGSPFTVILSPTSSNPDQRVDLKPCDQ